jgi:putative transposase
MAAPTTYPLTASPRVRKLLAQIVRAKQTNPALLVERANLILKMLDGHNNTQAARSLGLHRDTARYWRSRWHEASPRLTQAEELIPLEDETALLKVIEEILADGARSGNPGKFSAEQIAQIIALACEPPSASGYPLTHWSASDLRREILKRRLVPDISVRQVGRFLKRGATQTTSEPVLA